MITLWIYFIIMIVSNQQLTAERMLNHLEYEVHECCQINCPFQLQVYEGQRSYALYFNIIFFLDICLHHV